MSHVLEHLVDVEAELLAIAKVLSPTGSIFLEVPNRGGARTLPIDDNRSHLHFFCATSLTRLLARLGLETVSTATNARLDARYSDSLRVIAKPFRTPVWSSALFSQAPAFPEQERIVVWGAGSAAYELLANFFELDKVSFFIDRNAKSAGSYCLGIPVRPPDDLGPEPRTILVNSIDFAELHFRGDPPQIPEHPPSIGQARRSHRRARFQRRSQGAFSR